MNPGLISCHEFYPDGHLGVVKAISPEEFQELRSLFSKIAFNSLYPLLSESNRFENTINLSIQRKFDNITEYLKKLR